MNNVGAEHQLRKLKDHVYLVTYEKQFDVNMLFCRAQEFYECVNPDFRGKPFKMLDYIRWYSTDRDGSDGTFTYTTDWSGFNLPSHLLEELYCKQNIPDENDYDILMRSIYETLRREEGPDQKFYLAGTTEKGSALDHEMAHALWYVDDVYHEKQQANLEKIDEKHGPEIREAIRTALLKEGYCEEVVDDEAQAYLSTGLGGLLECYLSDLGFEKRKLTYLLKPFKDVFEEHVQSADMPWRTVTKKKRKKKAKPDEDSTNQ